MSAGIYDLIPGLKEAAERYRSDQLKAFTCLEPDICGCIAVKPFTPRMFIELDAVESKVLSPSQGIRPEDLGVFLWRISENYERGETVARKQFIMSLAVMFDNQLFEELTEATFQYLERTWSNMPLFGDSGSSYDNASSWISHIVHSIAKNYGWTEDTILDTSFRRLWQYINRIKEDDNPKYKERCPEVMRMRAEWLNSQNTRN
jgi:hypothetical protein